MRKQQTEGTSACFQVENISQQCFGTAFTSRSERKVLSRRWRRGRGRCGTGMRRGMGAAAAFIFTSSNSIPKKTEQTNLISVAATNDNKQQQQ